MTWLQSVMRLRVPLGSAFAVLFLMFARPATLDLFFVNAVLVIMGCALRSWAAGYLIKGRRIAVGGPYAYIRNPLYAGSFLIGLGFCVALWRQPLSAVSVLLWLVFLCAFFAIYPLKIQLEEKELLTTLGGAYAGYAGKVPSFLPWKGRVPDLGMQRFSGTIYLQNREYQCLLGAASVLSFIFFRYLLGS